MDVVWFTPIEREKPSASIENTGMVSLSFPLNTNPPEEWIAFFGQGGGLSTAFERPTVSMSGRRIDARCRDESVIGSLIENVDKRIAHANTQYEATVVPRLKAASEQRERDEDERQRKLEAALKAIEDHEGNDPALPS